MTNRIESRERIANAAATISVHLDRESVLSDDLTEILYHRTSRLVLQLGHGPNATYTSLSKEQAREVHEAIVKALGQWTTPLEALDECATAIECTCPDTDDVWCCELCRAYARMVSGLTPFGCPVHRPDEPVEEGS